jgi:hypothetical protein
VVGDVLRSTRFLGSVLPHDFPDRVEVLFIARASREAQDGHAGGTSDLGRSHAANRQPH